MNKTALNPINILRIFIVICLAMGFSSKGRSTGLASVAYPQRCGGTLDYLIRDEKGKLLSADQVRAGLAEIERGILYPNISRPSYLLSSVRYAPNTEYPMEELERAPKSLQFKTGCKTRLKSVALTYRNQVMILVFRNVPVEANFYVDSLPFQAGMFEIECSPKAGSHEVLGRMSSEELDKDEDLKKLKGAKVVWAKGWKKVN
jgi:hypothetical protein